jgi:hypothetical protein
MADKKELSERQQALIDFLMGEAKGNIRVAMDMAGYSKNTSTMTAIAPIKNEVVDAAQLMLAMNAPKAAVGMVGIIDDPSALGAKNVVAAAKEVLDRAGVIRKEKLEISSAEGGMFILPPKQSVECACEGNCNCK